MIIRATIDTKKLPELTPERIATLTSLLQCMGATVTITQKVKTVSK